MNALLEEGRRDEDLRHLLRREVGEAEFEYRVLVAGVHQRAGRLRRRRALAAGAAVAVLGPALLGGAAQVLPSLLPSGVDSVAAASTSGVAEVKEASAPPFQEGVPPLPAGGMESSDGANAWDIPDARPTDVAFLEELGAPRQGLDHADVVPVSGGMSCNTGTVDVQPVAGQSWFYYGDGGYEQGTIVIQVTGWSDSQLVRDLIRDDTMTSCVRATDTQWDTLEESEDLLLYRSEVNGLQLGFAVVRQGDYLLGVTVTSTDWLDNADTAVEIAAKTAANLEALDPVHGRD